MQKYLTGKEHRKMHESSGNLFVTYFLCELTSHRFIIQPNTTQYSGYEINNPLLLVSFCGWCNF
jgi:hypothetical protein